MKSCGKSDKIIPRRDNVLPGDTASGTVVRDGLPQVVENGLPGNPVLPPHTDALNCSRAYEIIGTVDSDAQNFGQFFDGNNIGVILNFN